MILNELTQYLEANGVGTVSRGRMPDIPDSSITLYEYGGRAPVFNVDGTMAWANPSVQAVVRDTRYDEARFRIQAVYNALNGKSNFLIGDQRYLVIKALQEPFLLEYDAKGRCKFAVNFEIARA